MQAKNDREPHQQLARVQRGRLPEQDAEQTGDHRIAHVPIRAPHNEIDRLSHDFAHPERALTFPIEQQHGPDQQA